MRTAKNAMRQGGNVRLGTKKQHQVEVPVEAFEPEAIEPEASDNDRIMTSLNRSQAVIEFTPTGEILGANENFLACFGYRQDEIVGRHHRMFVDPTEAASDEYRSFWDALSQGTFQSAEYRRIGKSGNEIWIQGTYNPVFDEDGSVLKVIKFATDITRQKISQREIQDRTQAVIEFEPDGTIITANHNFLATVGYSLDQVRGQHHRMFMPPEDVDTTWYREFWPSLARGEFRQGEFHRINSRGESVWLQGAYNPVFGSDGRVVRVMKSVGDITEQKKAQSEGERVGRSIAESVSEMTGAINEISQTVSRTAGLANSAEGSAAEASAKVEELNAASTTIGRVIDVIQGLSEQTNLLALNATIEAARAGEAGQGFAVVANEVKLLASQTSVAAGDIRTSIEAIQAEIQNAVSLIQAIADSVTEVSSMTTTVASAVEEQSALMDMMNYSAEQLLALNEKNADSAASNRNGAQV